jgi:hypothetical protein
MWSGFSAVYLRPNDRGPACAERMRDVARGAGRRRLRWAWNARRGCCSVGLRPRTGSAIDACSSRRTSRCVCEVVRGGVCSPLVMRSHASPTTREVCTRTCGRIGASGGDNSERLDRPKHSRREGRVLQLEREPIGDAGTSTVRDGHPRLRARSAASEGMAPIGALAHLEPDE